jgi:hypothetical protein
MITVKNIFLATVLITGSLAFVANLEAYYKNKAGNICPVKGDKFKVDNVCDGIGGWEIQVV